MPRSWLDAEPGARSAAGEIARLSRRAARRPLLVLSLTVLVAVTAIAVSLFKKQTFAPRVVLRAIESDTQYGIAPRAKRKLRDHVRDAVFSNQRLADVMHKHGLYASLARNNPQAALTSFKEDIEVEVYRNYFVEERMANDPPRSARIAIRYRSYDRRLALDVARELAALVAEHETQTRNHQLAGAVRAATAELARARAELLETRRELAEKMLQARLGDPQAYVEVANLERSLNGIERRVDDAEARRARLELNASMEAEQLGLRFEVVDAGAIPESAVLGVRDLIFRGLLGLILGLPFVVLAVGAFDTRIRDLEDLKRMGVAVLGRVRVSQEGYA